MHFEYCQLYRDGTCDAVPYALVSPHARPGCFWAIFGAHTHTHGRARPHSGLLGDALAARVMAGAFVMADMDLLLVVWLENVQGSTE